MAPHAGANVTVLKRNQCTVAAVEPELTWLEGILGLEVLGGVNFEQPSLVI